MASLIAKIMGLVFIIVGVAGFMPGHHHDLMGFGLTMIHTMVHLLSGVLALAMGFSGEKNARLYCLGFGSVYGLVTILGFLNIAFVVQLLNLNQADNFLHLGITAVLLIAGLMSPAGAKA